MAQDYAPAAPQRRESQTSALSQNGPGPGSQLGPQGSMMPSHYPYDSAYPSSVQTLPPHPTAMPLPDFANDPGSGTSTMEGGISRPPPPPAHPFPGHHAIQYGPGAYPTGQPSGLPTSFTRDGLNAGGTRGSQSQNHSRRTSGAYPEAPGYDGSRPTGPHEAAMGHYIPPGSAPGIGPPSAGLPPLGAGAAAAGSSRVYLPPPSMTSFSNAPESATALPPLQGYEWGHSVPHQRRESLMSRTDDGTMSGFSEPEPSTSLSSSPIVTQSSRKGKIPAMVDASSGSKGGGGSGKSSRGTKSKGKEQKVKLEDEDEDDELVENDEGAAGNEDNEEDEKMDHRKRKRNRTIRSCVPCHNHKRKVGHSCAFSCLMRDCVTDKSSAIGNGPVDDVRLSAW